MANRDTKLQIVIDAQDRASSTFAALGRNLDATAKRTADMRAGMQAVGTAGTAIFAALSLASAGSIKAAAEMEALTAGLTAVAGSSEKAQEQLKSLREVAKLPGLGLKEAIQGSINLQAAGFSAETAERSLKAFGNALATVGKGKAELSGVILALQQIASKGKISAEEINQLNERIPQIRQAMKDAFGTADTEELQRMGIDAQTFVDGVIKEFEKLPPVVGGTKIAFENVQDSMFLLANEVGKSLLPAVSEILRVVTPVIEKMAAWASEHPKLTAVIIGVTLVLTGLMAVLLPLSLALPALSLMFGAFGLAMAAVSLPMLLIIAGITAVAGAMLYLISQGYTTKEAWQNVWLGIKLTAADAANTVIGVVESMVNFVLSGVNKAIEAINKVISAANKVPGVKISSIGTIGAIDFGGINTDTIAASDLAGRGNGAAIASYAVNLIGGNFLSETVAEQIGDMLMSRLKLSSPI